MLGPGEFAVTAGWGVTGFEEGLSPTLMMLQVRTNFLYCHLDWYQTDISVLLTMVMQLKNKEVMMNIC